MNEGTSIFKYRNLYLILARSAAVWDDLNLACLVYAAHINDYIWRRCIARNIGAPSGGCRTVIDLVGLVACLLA